MATSQGGLSRAELRTWLRFTSGVFALFQALDKQLREESGVSLDDFGLLRPLWAAPDSVLNMSDLADQLSFSPSRLSHAVQRMEDKGWAQREPSSEDKRAKRVRLTPAGRAVFTGAWPGHAQQVRDLLLSQLDDDERETFEDTFRRIRSAARDPHPATDSTSTHP
jgi:DNA-binding MarR family transcriptional regulator